MNNEKMSLRDYFAGQALCGKSILLPGAFLSTPHEIANWCYKIADAMLEERNKENNNT
jgi:hypothetical protein